MQAYTRRRLSAWVLLLVFLPMLLAATLHHHEGVGTTGVVCVDCAHHTNHADHLQQGAASTDCCLLCQLADIPYLGAGRVTLLPCLRSQADAAAPASQPLLHRSRPHYATRAPPAVA